VQKWTTGAISYTRSDLAKMVATAQGRFLVDSKGKRSAVVLPVKDYEQLLEDLHDLAVVAERRNETPIDVAEIKRRLKRRAPV